MPLHTQHRRSGRVLLTIGAAATVAALLASCASGASPQPTKGTTSITLASQPNGAGLPFYIAEKLGYFTDEHLNVTIANYASGPASLAAGAAGQWQAGWLGAPPALTGAEKFGLIPVGVMDREDENHIMFIKASALKDSTPAQVIKDNPVATGQNTSAEQVMRACAEHFGVDGDAVKIVPLDGAGIVQAIQSGRVVAVNSWATPDWPLLNDKSYVQVCNGKQAGVAVLTPYVLTPKFVKAQPEAAAAFVRAVYRANAYIKTHQAQATTYMEGYYQQYGIAGDAKMAAYEVKIRDWYTLDQAIASIKDQSTQKGLKASADFFVKNGVYPKAPPVDSLVAQGLKVLEAAQKGQK